MKGSKNMGARNLGKPNVTEGSPAKVIDPRENTTNKAQGSCTLKSR